MRRRSEFLTFLSALFPGIGYMYLGLLRKGIQILVLFLLIDPVFRMLGIGYLADIIQIPFWFYTFFDTFSVAHRIDKGEFVPDSDFVFNKFTKEGQPYGHEPGIPVMSKNFWTVIAWVLIGVGALAILNKAFAGFELYDLIKSYISTYFVPVLFVAGGVYLLLRAKK